VLNAITTAGRVFPPSVLHLMPSRPPGYVTVPLAITARESSDDAGTSTRAAVGAHHVRAALSIRRVRELVSAAVIKTGRAAGGTRSGTTGFGLGCCAVPGFLGCRSASVHGAHPRFLFLACGLTDPRIGRCSTAA
jgi:hypothetical protein